MPKAARLADPTTHGPPLNPGLGCLTVKIGFQPAWRALPSGMASAVEGISNAMNSFMTRPQMTPVDATISLVQIGQALGQGGAAAAANGAPGAAGAAVGAVAGLTTANVALTTAWAAASVLPGGQPAANIAYTQGIKAAAAVAATSVVSAMAGISDMHLCPIPVPIPPHGPGFVTRGSSTVKIGNLPAARQGDRVFEACGGPDPIAMGCLTVSIGDTAIPYPVTVMPDGSIRVGNHMVIRGDPAYQAAVLADLSTIAAARNPDGSLSEGAATLARVDAGRHDVTIRAWDPARPGNACRDFDMAAAQDPTRGSASTVYYNPNDYQPTAANPAVSRPPDAGLHHELGHAGSVSSGAVDTSPATNPNNPHVEEETNIARDNRYRDARGVPRRADHGTL